MSVDNEGPFLTEDFSQDGGGIDFLGLRFVNLRILGTRLLPEINNAVRDFGTFCLATWIPWKFKRLCDVESYTEENYSKFREKIEVAISMAMRDDGASFRDFGRVRNRVGNNQRLCFGESLSFKNAGRKSNNTIFSAPLYGPSLRYLRLIDSYGSMADDGTVLNIPVISDDENVSQIAKEVDTALKGSEAYNSLTTLSDSQLGQEEVDDLSLKGLCPSYFRTKGSIDAKKSFAKKLIPSDPSSSGYARTKTALLLFYTLQLRENLTLDQIRNVWYTGHFEDGEKLNIQDEKLLKHLLFWEIFMAKQYQRYFTELFLWSFEHGIKFGCKSAVDVIGFITRENLTNADYLFISLEDYLNEFAKQNLGDEWNKQKNSWCEVVHGGHVAFEYIENPKEGNALKSGLDMLSGWYWRMNSRKTFLKVLPEYSMGGADRMSIDWLMNWIEERKSKKVIEFIEEIFNDLIFTQHIRIALSRFDGSVQRLRFSMGDDGIEQVGKKRSFGKTDPPWMQDRLDSFTDLLSDIGIFRKEGSKLSTGEHAGDFLGFN